MFWLGVRRAEDTRLQTVRRLPTKRGRLPERAQSSRRRQRRTLTGEAGSSSSGGRTARVQEPPVCRHEPESSGEQEEHRECSLGLCVRHGVPLDRRELGETRSPVWKIQFHARWASEAVKAYTEETFAEVAEQWTLRGRQETDPPVIPLQRGCQVGIARTA